MAFVTIWLSMVNNRKLYRILQRKKGEANPSLFSLVHFKKIRS